LVAAARNIRGNAWTQQPGAATNAAKTGNTNLSPSQKNALPKNSQGVRLSGATATDFPVSIECERDL
jgi:hypothetical protein